MLVRNLWYSIKEDFETADTHREIGARIYDEEGIQSFKGCKISEEFIRDNKLTDENIKLIINLVCRLILPKPEYEVLSNLASKGDGE